MIIEIQPTVPEIIEMKMEEVALTEPLTIEVVTIEMVD
jgi:hypothetical protein